MKILHVSPVLHPCFHDLVKEQNKTHSLIFVKLDLTAEERPYRTTRDWNGLLIENVKRSQIWQHDDKLLNIFNQMLRAYRPKLIHIQVFSGISLLPILKAASNLHITKIITLHDHSLFCVPGICFDGHKKCRLDSLLSCECSFTRQSAANNRSSLHHFNQARTIVCKKIIDQCDQIICPSHHQREQLVRLFGQEDKFVTEYYGTNPRSITSQKKRGAKVTFGYLGTLWWAKGISLIEAAIDKLKDCDFNVLMGVKYSSQEPSAETHLLERLKNNSKIRLKLNIGRDKIYDDFFSQVDYLIIPSVWDETGPMTLFEAFSYGVPVIISNVPSMTEKIKENKSSMVFNDENELADIMRGIVEKRIKKNQGDKFSVKNISEYSRSIERIYEKALAATSRGLFLRLGFECNSKCVFCVIEGGKLRIDLNAVRDIFEKNQGRYDYVVLTGGEPTIRKDFFDILDIARRSGYAIKLQTHGRMFASEEFCEKISPYNVEFSININGSTATIHDTDTQAPGSFEQTVKGIKTLRKLDSDILVKIILTKNSYQHLLQTARFIAGLDIKKIMFVFPTPYGAAGMDFDAVVPRMSETLLPLTQAVHWLKKNTKVKISIEGFSRCCLNPEFHPLITECDMLDGIIPENNRRMYNAKEERVFIQKQKFFECRDCIYDKECEGVYKTYAAKMGKDEFRPVLKK